VAALLNTGGLLNIKAVALIGGANLKLLVTVSQR